jgi:acetyl esterase/lipase
MHKSNKNFQLNTKKMKKMLIFALILCATATISLAQEVVPTNRYAMKLKASADGSYTLLNEHRYAKLVDLSKLPDLLVPYTHQNNRLSSKDYKGIEVKEVIYRTHKGYELQLAIDMAVSENPTPVMFFVHGGGWARGSNASSRSLSQYLAKQKGITGVRIQYSLAPQPGATVEVTIEDIEAAVEYIRKHAKELNIDASRMGFYGTSAGAHLAGIGAMKSPEAKVFVGVSGIYDLETAAICMRAKQEERINYFCQRNPSVLHRASPINLIPKRCQCAVMLFCGTADITVECDQSRQFAEALQRKGVKEVSLAVYENYDHNLSAKASDKMEEIFFRTVDFIVEHL